MKNITVRTNIYPSPDCVTVVPGAEQGAGAAPALGCGGDVTPGAELGQAADGGAVPGHLGAVTQEGGQHLYNVDTLIFCDNKCNLCTSGHWLESGQQPWGWGGAG